MEVRSMSTAFCLSLLLLAQGSWASPVPAVLLQNAADPGVWMPMAGLGTGNLGVYGHNEYAATNATLSWLNLGGRRTDSADSYGDEVGIGLAMRTFCNRTGVPRSALFVESKIGPGGLSFPLGFNETLSQARGIVANYSIGGFVDLLLVHWPVNYGPCSYPGPPGPSIPTSDPVCDTSLKSYSERGCRISTWKAMLQVWKSGLVRAIGVSNWNSTHLQDLIDEGLPLPSVNQVQWSPFHKFSAPSSVTGGAETAGELLRWCQQHNVLVNGWAPFGGPGKASKLLGDSRLKSMASRHNVSVATLVLHWQTQLGIAVNPEASNPVYQQENLDIFGFNLSTDEMTTLNSWAPNTD